MSFHCIEAPRRALVLTAALAAFSFVAATAATAADTIKVGMISSYSGLNGEVGPVMEKAMRLYMKEHAKDLPAGVTVELLTRDDTGPNPDKAKQLAQDLVVRDKVQFLTGVIFTPNALAIAPIATEAKVPFVISNAGTAMITTKSPYIARVSFTLWQSSYPLGNWAAKKYKRAYTMVSDYGPGIDAEQAFTKAFTAGGGAIAGSVRVPVVNPDFAPFLQRVKDTKPDTLFVFVPAGTTATAVMKGFGDIGLKAAGVKLIGPGDITDDMELDNMGDVALGVTTAFHYSDAADRPANKAFIAAWKKEYGLEPRPNFTAVGAWDSMDAIYQVIAEQKGKIDPDKTMALLKQWKNPNSPRGPVAIDPDTRDIVQNEYLREVRKVGGHYVNVEIETIATALKDPWKVLNPGK
jgi:branched-chain amino acid transport system substrate-binding protein